MPEVSLNGIEFTIKGSSDSASSSITRLIEQLNKLNTALGNLKNVSAMSSSIKQIDTANKSIAEQSRRMRDLHETTKNMRSLWTDLAGGAKLYAENGVISVNEVQHRLETFDPFKYVGATLWQPITAGLSFVEEQLERSGISFKDLASAERAATENATPFVYALESIKIGVVGILQGINQATIAIGKGFLSALKAAGKGVLSLAKNALKLTGGLLASPFKSAAKSVVKFVSGLKTVLSSFKRVLFYRAVRALIKEIGQAFSEGIKNLYGWSSLVGGKFAASMNQITTSLTYFKNSIGAAVAPIVNALAPALDFLIDKVVALINVINQLFAKLSGATSWTRAIKKAQEYDDAVSGAGGSAKEALKYLAPFDELNRLPSDNKGGGGGGADNDYSGMFEDVTEFSEGISNFADTIRKAIAEGDWQGVGTLLGEKVNSIIESIDFAGLGTKVGEKINALFTTEYWTLKTINFQNIGAKIAEFLTGEDGIGGALREIDFSNIGGIIAEKLTALPEVLIGVVNNLDFSVVGKNLGDTIRGFLDGITEFIKNVDWGTTLENAVTGMFEFVKGMDIMSLAESLLTLLGSVVGAVADGLGTLMLDLVDVIINPDTWVLVEAWLKDFPAKFKQLGIDMANAMGEPITKVLNSIGEFYNTWAPDWLKDKLGEFKEIEFKLIPDIPEEELTKNYDAAKATIEARSKKSPTVISSIADIIKSSQSNLAAKYKTVSTTANFTARTDGLSKTEKSFNTKAIFTSRRNDLTASDKSIYTKAIFNSRRNDLTDAEKSFYTKAIFNSRRNDLTESEKSFYTKALFNDSSDNLTDAKRTIDTTAKWSKQEIGDTWEGTTWASTAKWEKQIIGDSWPGTTWDSIANFVKWDAANKTTDGEYVLPVFADIKRTSNVPMGQANGGAYYGGSWHDIPQYASGGRPHGSLFVAGEAGPEVVGHVGGRTEVLNQSQLAATMYAAVRSALSGLYMTVSAPSVVSSADNAVSEETMYRAFSRALADSDLGGDIELDGDVLYSAMVNRNRRNTRLTGVNAMA